MRHLGLFSCLCLTATATAAPAKGPLPGFLRDYAQTHKFLLGRPQKARPAPDGLAVLFLRAPARVPELWLYEFDVRTGQTRKLLSPEDVLKGAAEALAPEERARRERMRVAVRGFTSFDLSRDGETILLTLSGRLYTIERRTLKVRELRTGPTPAIDPQLSPDGHKVAYVRERDLYVLDLPTQRERRLTKSGHPHITNGLAEFVAQEEMHRYSGFAWAPDSRRLVFEEADSRAVEVFHIVDPAHPEAVHESSYPRPGKDNARVRLGIVWIDKGAKGPAWVRWDAERFPYLCTFRWPENAHAPLTLVVMDRRQQELQVLAVDAEDGRSAALLEERDERWLNLDQDVPRWLPDGSAFLWTSERRGGRELELRDPKGQLVRVLVPKEAGYHGLVDVDEQRRTAVYAAAEEPTQRHLFRVSLDGGAPEPLGTPAAAIAHAVFGKDHAVYVQTTMALAQMPRATVHRHDGTLLGELPSVAEEPKLRPQVEIAAVGAQAFRTAVVRPRDFVPGRKYPVVVHVYGGPASLQVQSAMPLYLLPQWIADHGFIVVSADGRGTPGRGREWERAIRGNFAEATLADQVAALQELGRRHPEMDLSRVGVYGWSFGGYMAALMVLRRPDVFKVGVAGAPVVDWRDYDTFYTERYLDLPQHNPGGYEASSLLTYARDLSRPLLLIHGTGDDNVYFFHSLKLSHALFRAGRPHDFLPLSGMTHMVPDPVATESLWGRVVAMLSGVLHP